MMLELVSVVAGGVALPLLALALWQRREVRRYAGIQRREMERRARLERAIVHGNARTGVYR